MASPINTSPAELGDSPPKYAVADDSPPPEYSGGPSYQGYDHVTWFVGNAKQAASYFITRMGFKCIAYKGLETGSKAIASYIIGNNAVKFVLTSVVRPRGDVDDNLSEADKVLLQKVHDHVAKHGDAVSDVAFEVDNVEAVYGSAIANGAIGIQPPVTTHMGNGRITLAIIKTYGDTTHTFVERCQYNEAFLPSYVPVTSKDPVNDYLPAVEFEAIDHCVGNQDWHELQATTDYYEKCLGFHRFWTIDDREMCTEFSAMNSVVVMSPNGVVKMPINEPAKGLKKSQIEEFVKYNGGPGTQHMAFRTPDIVDCVISMKRRGVQFIDVPKAYYNELRDRLNDRDLKVQEDLSTLEQLSILVDFDEGGYLLQLFTKPLSDRPTVFIEIIQRNNFDGFGAGNFKALFSAIEREQAKRGEL